MQLRWLAATLTLCLLHIAAPQDKPGRQAGTAQKKEQVRKKSFLDWLLDVTNISATPRTLKGTQEEMGGDLWVMSLETGARQRVTFDGGYRSPIFVPESETFLAVRGNDIVRIPAPGAAPERLRSFEGLIRLIAVHRYDADKLVLLRSNPDVVGVLSLSTGAFAPYQGDVDPVALSQLRAFDTIQGRMRIYHRREESDGPINVCVEANGAPPRNLTECRSEHCLQPALSPDGRAAIFIRAKL